MINKVLKFAIRTSGQLFISFGRRIESIADIFYFMPRGEREFLNKNSQYKDKHKGKRAFIVANGPSIAEQDLALLKDEITYTMSGIWKHPLIDEGWEPSYYCLADPVFFEEKEGFDSIKNFFENIRKKMKKTIFFMPFPAKKSIEKNHLLDGLNINYVQFDGNLASTNKKALDLTANTPGVQSVAQMGLELAIYMGCNPIYLLGFDHDWLSKRGMDRHFYQGKTLENHTKAHGNLDKLGYKEDLIACLALWNGYEAALKIAEKRNINILNATCGGFLDVFPRVDYEDLFIDKSKK